MSKAAQISGGQARSLIASFAIDTPWDEINVNVQPFIELPPEQRGRLFAAFVKNNFRVIIGDQKSVVVTKPFNPTEFIGEGWTTWNGPIDEDGLSGDEDVDQRSLVMTEIELAKFVFEACILAGEESITGEEKLRRLKEEKPEFIRFGGNVFLGLWLDYQANKENSILEWLHRNCGVTFMDFMGQILRSPGGGRDVLCLGRGGGGTWRWDCNWLGLQWDASTPSAGCAS